MRLASIDIGTNTILMLIADVESNCSLTIVKDEHSIGRLGKGVDEHGIILKETFQRTLAILTQLKKVARDYGVQHFAVCGTSALRDAANRKEFIKFIYDHLKLKISVLSGDEEAHLTYLGAISEYLQSRPDKHFAVLDIGGGSTELIVGCGLTVTSATSLNIGSVRITERFLKISPPVKEALDNAVRFIQEQFHALPILRPDIQLIGVAGTLTTLAALDLRLKEFDRDKINRHILTLRVIENIFDELRRCSLDQLKTYPSIHPLRADIILAGILILREIMVRTKSSQIMVSDRGLRYGLLMRYSGVLQKA